MYQFVILVLSLPVSVSVVNIAKGKPTQQSSTLRWIGGNFESGRAVDGNKASSLFAGSCSHTRGYEQPWFYVDLLKEENVEGFELTNRGDCCGNRLDSFEVYVGNSKEKGGIRNTKCIGGQKVPQGESKRFTCVKPILGRYVYVRLPRQEGLAICELEVYAKATSSRAQPQSMSFKTVSYDGNNGKCIHVGFFKEMTTWCTNNDRQVFVQINGKWTLVDGRLKSISVGPAGIWGVSAFQKVYFRQGVSDHTPEGMTWTQLDGALNQITSGPDGVVWGVTPSQRIHCRREITYSNPLGSNWDEMPLMDGVVSVSCNEKGCWALKRSGRLMFRKGVTKENPMGVSWLEIFGERGVIFVDIESSADGHSVVALSNDQRIYKWTGEFRGNNLNQGVWRRIDDALYAHAMPANGGVIAAAKNGDVKFIMEVPKFVNVYKPMDNIDAGGDTSVCGVHSDNIYQMQGRNWIKMDGALKQVSCSDHQMWGVNRFNDIYYRIAANRTNHFGSGWERIPGSLKHVDIGMFGMVYGVNTNDQVYRREGISQDQPQGNRWVSVPGRLSHVSCGNLGCWGVDYRKKVYMLKIHPRYRKHLFQAVDKQALRKVEASDDGLVFGICDQNILRMRMGVSKMNPMGSGWVEMMDKVKDVAPHKGGLFVIDTDKQVKHTMFK